MSAKHKLSNQQQQELLDELKKRFDKNTKRHLEISWEEVLIKLNQAPDKLWSLYKMEQTGGEPDIVVFDKSGEYFYCDCSVETPKGRRSLCYDREGLDSRKEFKPENNAVDMAHDMGIELLNEEQYRHLQKLGNFDTKTSSWILTPKEIRNLGGALFADYRYGQVFVYHNGAQSYYAVRGFRGLIRM